MIIKTEQDEIQNYLTDASNTKGFCEAVYIPENVEELKKLVKDLNNSEREITISGNRTGLTGASMPQGGVVISTEKFNRIIEINTEEQFVIVESGVLLSELQDSVNTKGLFYPPDPTERNCFIGGNVATNASGARTFKYGPTRNYVEELDIVLTDGDSVHLVRGKNIAKDFSFTLTTDSGKKINLNIPQIKMPETKNASGYFCKKDMDAIDLFIGSEGTLGIITMVKLKLIPQPVNELSCVLFFESEEKGLNFLIKAREESYKSRKEKNTDGIDATVLELYDENSLKFLENDFPNIPAKAKAAIWFEQECDNNEDRMLELWINLFAEFGGNEEEAWFASTQKDKESLVEFRHAISENTNEYITRHNVRKLGTDVAVPDDKLIEFYNSAKKLVEKSKLQYLNYGHFGNSHMHLNMLPKNEEEFVKGKKLYQAICELAIKMGGTFSAEHGVGKNKTEYLVKMYGEENVNKMRLIKKSLDPNYILGVGNIFEK
jgi:D-lactate dehydrogenase (cytochrome)